ncbi:hypothetical protein AJ87_26955 [Rhizobium yanglingense]|nr:hypothetical protein AJ87_26955 [Rhizobium yanglingense]
MRKAAFIGESAPGFNNIVADVAAERAAEGEAKARKARGRAPKSGKSVGSQLGGADDIQL